MLMSNGSVINRQSARYKYGNDPVAEYVDFFGPEEFTDRVAYHGVLSEGAALIGRRIFCWNEQGFVELIRYRDENEASSYFLGIEAELAWSSDDMEASL